MAANENTAYVQFMAGTSAHMLTKPNKRVLLKLPCSGNGCKSQQEYDWTCQTCQIKVEYGFDGNVYCKCGQTSVTSMQFRCPHPGHGPTYEQHQSDILSNLLNQLQAPAEMNILILGETGVGKSTWINGFVNYMTFETLQEAEAGEPVTLIPSQFTICNDNYDEITICTGKDNNEVNEGGKSATQEAKVYAFPMGDTTVRLIDTPGVGDTRGVEQDQINFKSILATLTHFDEIHGICILLKPNNARLGVMFRFCIKELLTYLHRGACKNIVFCFTNTSGTFYKPGETMKPLKTLLAENQDVEIPIGRDTIYCYDSEAYRFLAAVKNQPPITFSDDERVKFSKSWQISVDETKRMLKHFQGIAPHDTKSTLNLNYARNIVLCLPKPLAEINMNLQENKTAMENEMMEIEKSAENIEELKKNLKVKRKKLMVKPLPSEVTSGWTFLGLAAVATISAFTIPLAAPMIAAVAITSLAELTTAETEEEYTDPNVEKLLEAEMPAQEMKEKMIEAKRQEIQECENELDQIEQASVTFAYFLKSYSITPYNDAMEHYLNILIQEEEKKKSSDELERLIEMKNSYVEQRDILEGHLNRSSSDKTRHPPGPKDVDQWIRTLQVLKHSGPFMVKVLECVTSSHNATYNETVVKSSGKLHQIKKFFGKWSGKVMALM